MATEKKVEKKPAKDKAATPAKAKAVAPAPAATAVSTANALQKRRTVVGTVVSDKMAKTIVVKVDRQVRHSMYKKYVVRSRRFKAHDERNEAKVGDRVMLVESRPMSREKRWVLQSIIRKAGQVLEISV